MSTSNNSSGRNQYGTPQDYTEIDALIIQYQKENVTSPAKIVVKLKDDLNVVISQMTVRRRRNALGLAGPRQAARRLTSVEKRQLVLDQMADDPRGNRGPRGVQENLAWTTQIQLPRHIIKEIMRQEDPEGFDHRDPTAKKVHRSALHSLGPNHEWSGDGHEKLNFLGLPIWGVRDKFSGKWLKLWVLPDNRLEESIAILFVLLVQQLGGVPIQMTTDKGSETGLMFGLMNALREAYGDIDINEVPAHVFLKSIHNITIERGWLRLRMSWGDNVRDFYEQGQLRGIFNPGITAHHNLSQWLWPKLIQQELDEFCARENAHHVRKDKNKILPSGCTHNEAYAHPEKWNGVNCLVPVPSDVIDELLEEMGGADKALAFVEREFAEECEIAYETLELKKLTLHNIWDVFEQMLPLVFHEEDSE